MQDPQHHASTRRSQIFWLSLLLEVNSWLHTGPKSLKFQFVRTVEGKSPHVFNHSAKDAFGSPSFRSK